MNLKLIRPTAELEKEALDFREEFFAQGETVINGSELLDQTDSYTEWLKAVTNNADSKTVSPDWVVTDTFFVLDADRSRMVGIIDLRHTLNDFLVDFGNSGYSVRPSERKKGYGAEMLRLLLDVARKAGLDALFLSVERDNTPSVKTITKNGGVYERSFAYEGALADVYRIPLIAPSMFA